MQPFSHGCFNCFGKDGRKLIYSFGETDYQAKSWKGLDTRIIYKAEVNQKGDNPRFIVTSIKKASAEDIYEDLYCPRGQDENFIKHLKSDLSGDRLSDQGFLANIKCQCFAQGKPALSSSIWSNSYQMKELWGLHVS